jgi:hypothetical protein
MRIKEGGKKISCTVFLWITVIGRLEAARQPVWGWHLLDIVKVLRK